MNKFAKYFIFAILISGFVFPSVLFAADETPKSWMQIYPECIQQQMQAKPGDTFSKQCDDVGVFIQLAINIGAYLFTFIGALALLVFVYGGFKMIISGGDSAKIKEGKDAMVAAVIGIVIAFSGVAIVSFLGDSLKLKEEYKLKEVLLGNCRYSVTTFEGTEAKIEWKSLENISESDCKTYKNSKWTKNELK